MQLGDKTLSVQLASLGSKGGQPLPGQSSNSTPLGAGGVPMQMPMIPTGPAKATEVLCLLNMVTPEELQDDEEFEGRFFSFHLYIYIFFKCLIDYLFYRYCRRC